MRIINLNDCQVKDTPHNVDVRLLYDRESVQVNVVTLFPGEGLKPHITPTDVFFYILEGTPEIWVGNERSRVEKDTLVESPANIIHTMYNFGDTVARIMVVKAPRPVEKTKVL